MHELVGNMHIHTPFSDGEKWHDEVAAAAIAAGLDFIIVTDHNVLVKGVEGYYEHENGRLLLLTGEEIHNVRRRPQANHLLVYGADVELAGHAANPQGLIDAVRTAGGLSFLAHPHEKDCRLLDHDSLGWQDWDIEGFTGLEIWNYMSSFINRLTDALEALPVRHKLLDQITALRLALNPEKTITTPERITLDLWDELLAAGKEVTAVGSSDAHGTPMRMGPISRVIYPYEFLFRAVNTHLWVPEPLHGDLKRDKSMIYHAIGKGNSWVGYDLPHPTTGFRFSGHGRTKGQIGDRVQLDAGATLQVITPAKANIKIVRHGKIVAAVENETSLMHIPVDPGAYRVECTIPYQGKERGWIYSNPIYLF